MEEAPDIVINEEAPPVVSETPLMRTTIREQITPYLPPPMVSAMRQIDPQLEEFIGPEPSITILGTFALALVLWQILLRATGRGGKAIQDDDDQEDTLLRQTNQQYFDSTILLCGPSLAGKTSLFYTLVYPEQTMLGTVKSVSSNAGFKEHEQDSKVWRYLDTPGYWGADKLISVVIEKENIDRIILVLDSTQPVSKAADYLYALVQQNLSIPILVACHKAKAPKAKNFRRIKLNLRNELERLEKLRSNDNTTLQDWDAVLGSLDICSCSVDPPLLEDIRSFCFEGKLN